MKKVNVSNINNEFDLYHFKLDELLTELLSQKTKSDFDNKMTKIITELNHFYNGIELEIKFKLDQKSIDKAITYKEYIYEFLYEFKSLFYSDFEMDFDIFIKYLSDFHSLNFDSKIYYEFYKNIDCLSIFHKWINFVFYNKSIKGFINSKYYLEGSDFDSMKNFINFVNYEFSYYEIVDPAIKKIKYRNNKKNIEVNIKLEEIIILFQKFQELNYIKSKTILKNIDLALIISKLTGFSEDNIENKLSKNVIHDENSYSSLKRKLKVILDKL